MKKSIKIIDQLLLLVFLLIVISRIINFQFINLIQGIFFILIAIHIYQHRKVIIYSILGFKKKQSKK